MVVGSDPRLPAVLSQPGFQAGAGDRAGPSTADSLFKDPRTNEVDDRSATQAGEPHHLSERDRRRRRHCGRSPEVAAALEAIREAFAAIDRIGARSYARFLAIDARDEPQLELRAVGAIAEFAAALPNRS